MDNINFEKREIPFSWLIIGLLATLAFFSTVADGQVSKVESVGFTVSDMDKAIDFYTRILPFEKVSDAEIWGADYERLSGVFGACGSCKSKCWRRVCQSETVTL